MSEAASATAPKASNNRNKYAPASAPWKRPEAQLEKEYEDSVGSLQDPGAFRVIGHQSFSVLEDDDMVDLAKVAEQVQEEPGVVSVGSVEGDDNNNWDTETATMDMLVQLKRRMSQRNSLKRVVLPPETLAAMQDSDDDDDDEEEEADGTDQQKEEEAEVISTECHWAVPPPKTIPKPEYAAAIAPWTRPTGERQVSSSSDLEEIHSTPGAFRISKYQDDPKKKINRLSFGEGMQLDEEEVDDIVVAKEAMASDAFASADLEQSKEVLEQLRRRNDWKHAYDP